MKIAFFVYPSAFQNMGGGEVLLLKTKEYLEKEGVSCKLFDIWRDKLEEFDILHVVGAVKCCLGLMQTAKNKGVKIVLDPVFFSTFQRAMYEEGSFIRKSEAVARHLTKIVLPYLPSSRRKMMVLADAVIPNSKVEERQIARLFGIPREKMHIIPNCVDKEFEYFDKNSFISKYKVSDFVLSVGRIEPRKNQLNLIRAMKGSSRKLVIVGNPVSDYTGYYDRCRLEGEGNVVFIDRLDHADPMLKSAYGSCACFASQGWFETPGLAALEAALAGAKIATTNQGCTREYFLDLVEYFNPSDARSIRETIEKAVAGGKDSLLKDHVKKEFLWEAAARKNIEVYNKLLKK